MAGRADDSGRAAGGWGSALWGSAALWGCLMMLLPGGGTPGRATLAGLAACVLFPLVLQVAAAAVRFGGDRRLLAAVGFLTGFGSLVQYRLQNLRFEAADATSHAALLGGVACLGGILLLLRKGRYRFLAGAGWPALAGAIAVLAVILAGGRRYRGMVFLPGNINPSELVKPLLLIFIVAGLARLPAGPMPFRRLLVLALGWLVPMALLAAQRDLGLILLLNAVLAVLVFVSRGGWLIPAAGTAVAAGGAYLASRIDFHGGARIAVWLNPFEDPTGQGWQVLQGLSAMYAGGLTGAGFGVGSPEQVPIAASDFVYAAAGEEFGYIGCGVLLAAEVMLICRAVIVARGVKDPFGFHLAAGAAAMLGLQALVNVGGVVKAIPMTGITLPFVSHGGSSLIASCILAGLVLAVSDGSGGVGGGRAPGRRKPAGGRKKGG